MDDQELIDAIDAIDDDEIERDVQSWQAQHAFLTLAVLPLMVSNARISELAHIEPVEPAELVIAGIGSLYGFIETVDLGLVERSRKIHALRHLVAAYRALRPVDDIRTQVAMAASKGWGDPAEVPTNTQENTNP